MSPGLDPALHTVNAWAENASLAHATSREPKHTGHSKVVLICKKVVRILPGVFGQAAQGPGVGCVQSQCALVCSWECILSKGGRHTSGNLSKANCSGSC